MIFLGDALDGLRDLSSDSIDSLVTDPPAGISFMGKDWDHHKGGRDAWVKWMTEVMKECHRVLKPGAHGLVWALPRTSHWTAWALEEAGFEIRDCVSHIFGSGFPKSANIEKHLEKANHPDAKNWAGYGTALKPAVEKWWLIRKPLSEKTVAKNVLKHGTGALNIDGSRVATSESDPNIRINKTVDSGKTSMFGIGNGPDGKGPEPKGRFPANLIVSGEAREVLDEQSGVLKSGGKQGASYSNENDGVFTPGGKQTSELYGSFGGASRFFFDGADPFLYCAKASKTERNAGLEGIIKEKQGARPNSKDNSGKFPDHDHRQTGGNNHPTVKAQKLMRYLCKMITPPNGIVLDPFMGSGSTGVAAYAEGFKFVGIEKEKEYFDIAKVRMRK